MKKIILASGSPHRKELLKLLGLKFIVKKSRARETKEIVTTCEALVKENALNKARDVAGRLNEGIVIGADTLVYLENGTIIGKPRNLAEAKKILKYLSCHPSWVYTGLAVIDAKTGKTIQGCEKTKIFMEELSDTEINRYYAHVSPFDKAGGFDIEGRGGVWIKRIEGCYFNVVGLPISRLYQMLKKFGVVIGMLVLMVGAGGCVTEYNLATKQQETLLYGTDKEIKIGESVAREFDKQNKMVTDVDVNERVNEIADKIFEVCDRKELVYTIKIIDDDKVNALSLPGGFVYLFKGLVDKVDNDDQLACVIAHEVGHITARHSIKKIQGMYGYSVLMILAAQSGNADLAQGVDLAMASIFTAYSQQDEFEADRLGIKYAQKAGYDPKAMAGFLKRLLEIQAKEPPRDFSYWRTHPFIPQRIAASNQVVSGQLEFKDYLNLTGE
ncbi:MAG TPA: Maf family nucleotide pyrophosphatase [Candidatus Omnitrophota bacterium]|nr:Maf family nucleotide pyrophosphatase [Candidatus Omnitrophota bacterium]HPD84806.1 Maf family nucleotide pyrophosphatase [Candidatus Omnitrophota bacterium]HRZ03664.1 Maf family nucleotide pyrophosphatase [Candidatus Omnitrophota bacterium]